MSPDTSRLVSVVVPSYRHEKYLERCLTSIFRQSYRNLEIVAIDDGSPDGSLQMLRRLRRQSPFPMQVVAQHNRGAGSTINRAIRMSRGSFVNIINTDDEFHDGRIDALMLAMQAAGSQFAFARVRYVDDDGVDVTFTDDYAHDLHDKQSRIKDFPSVGFALMTSNVTISTGNFLFARTLYDELEGFNESYHYCHDWDFVLRALALTEPVYVDQALYLYRLHVGNSFRGLANAAGREGPALLRNFFRLMLDGPRNVAAPSPRHWGEFFWRFVGSYPYLWPLVVADKVTG